MNERGAGLVGLISGVVVFLALMLFAVQLLTSLHTTSMVATAAQEAAHLAATTSADASALAGDRRSLIRGETRARALLGRFADEVTFDWSATTDDLVQLRVEADAPRFEWPGLHMQLGFEHIERTVRVRVERVR